MSLRNPGRETQLRSEILERVRELVAIEHAPQEFIPGRTPIRYAGRVFDHSEIENLVQSALEAWLTAGRWHHKLEKGLAEWYGVAQARLVNSGSSANLVATASLMSPLLGADRLQPGDEVITVAAGFPTTVTPSVQHGLVPVFVDIAVPSYNIDCDLLTSALTSRSRAVIVAHTLGNPFDLTAVSAFCKKHNLWLIEDNCDAAGSLYQGRKTGSFGALATLSFYPPHHMTMGEGGAVLINDERLIRPVESLRDWGKDCWCIPGVDNSCGKRFQWELGQLPCGYDHKYIFSHVGYNLKITDMQAAVGCAQLDKLDDFNQARRNNWAYFRQALAPLADRIILPEPSPDSDPSWFGFMMTIRPEARFNRDELVRHLESKKIQTRMLFAGNLVKQPAFTDLAERARANGVSAPFRSATPLEKTDLAMTNGVWVGVYPGLTEAMREFVATETLSFANQR